MLYQRLSDYYDRLFPLRESRLSFISSRFDENVRSILDIGCATGELALSLSNLGYRVSGIDLDPEMIRIARKKKGEQKGNPVFQAGDMTGIATIFNSDIFDRILCFGNTLVHLRDRNAILQLIEDVYHLLRKKGEFIIQIVNYERILAGTVKDLPPIEREEIRFTREYTLQQGRIHFKGSLIIEKQTVTSHEEILYPLTATELTENIAATGFSRIELFGDEDGSPFSPDSPALIVVLKK
mgnify:CR=1 FL=1